MLFLKTSLTMENKQTKQTKQSKKHKATMVVMRLII